MKRRQELLVGDLVFRVFLDFDGFLLQACDGEPLMLALLGRTLTNLLSTFRVQASGPGKSGRTDGNEIGISRRLLSGANFVDREKK